VIPPGTANSGSTRTCSDELREKIHKRALSDHNLIVVDVLDGKHDLKGEQVLQAHIHTRASQQLFTRARTIVVVSIIAPHLRASAVRCVLRRQVIMHSDHP
jgi:hypothetical protein